MGATPACISATATCGRCTEGALQCNGDVPQRCDATGQWVPQPTCTGALPQCLAGTCVACDPSEGDRSALSEHHGASDL